MDSQSSLDPKAQINHVAEGIAAALSRHAGETAGRRDVASVMEFQPRDGIEAMLAGHCVIFHELIVEAVAEWPTGQNEVARRATAGSLAALDKAFGANFTRLERYRARQEKARAADLGIADRSVRHGGEAAVGGRADVRRDGRGESAGDSAAPADVEDAAGGLERFAAQLAGLNRQARRELGRQARKGLGSPRKDADVRRVGGSPRPAG